jgi:hypothetical protein
VVNLKASMNANSEVPPNDSKGTGTLTATYDTSGKKLSWKGSYSDLTGPATTAHFHSGTRLGTKSSMAALGYVAYVQQLIQPPCRWLTEHGPQPPPFYVLLNPASSNLPNRRIKKPFDRAQRFQRPILITAPISHFRVVLFIKRHVSETTFAVQNPADSGRRQAVPLHGIVAQ